MSTARQVPVPSLTGLTPAQQRRANALILVAFLWPALDSGAAVRRANWLITGRPVP